MWISKDEHQIIYPLTENELREVGNQFPATTFLVIQILGRWGLHLYCHLIFFTVTSLIILLHGLIWPWIPMYSILMFISTQKKKNFYVYKRDNCNSHTRSTECTRQGCPLSRWTKPLEFEGDAKTIKKIRQQPPLNYPVCSWFILSVSFCILFLRDMVQTCICRHF